MCARMRWFAIGAAAALGIAMAGGEAIAQPRSYSSVLVVLALDGEWMGPVTESAVGTSAFDDIVIHFDAGVSNRLLTWANDALAGRAQRKSGALFRFDADRRETGRREFVDAAITEIGLPRLDAASRDASLFTMRLKPASGRFMGPGNPRQVYSGSTQQSPLLPSNFRVAIDGLNAQFVSRIDSIGRGSAAAAGRMAEQKMSRPMQGQMETAVKAMPGPGRMEAAVAPITVFMFVAASGGETWNAWATNAPAQKKNGSIDWLKPDRQHSALRADLSNLGIVRIDQVPAQGDSIRLLRVQMTAEAVTLSRP